MDKNLKVVILCGGRGTRLNEETEFKPKPLVHIGQTPILMHIMKIYSFYGFNNFILCLGYKSELIKEYFLNLDWFANDFTLQLGYKHRKILKYGPKETRWNITFVDTQEDTPTGGRIYKIKRYINEESFLLTYGDGLSNVNIDKLIKFHNSKGKIAALTAVHPMSPFGIIEIENGLVKSFKEKPRLDGFINGGFFVFNKKIFEYLDENSVLEEEPLRKLTKEKQLAVYQHNDFWACMDTYKDVDRLNKIWESGKAPWKILER